MPNCSSSDLSDIRQTPTAIRRVPFSFGKIHVNPFLLREAHHLHRHI